MQQRNAAAITRFTPLWLFVFLVSIYVLTSGGHTYAPDDESIVHVIESFFSHDKFDQPAPGTAVTVGLFKSQDGLYYAPSGIAQPVLAMPLFILGRALARGYDSRFTDFFTRLALGLFNPLVSAVLATLLFGYARGLGYSLRIAVGLALVWGLATNAWSEAKSFYNEPLTALCLLLAFYSIYLARHKTRDVWFLLGGLAWGVGLATKLHAILALPALSLYVILPSPRDPRDSTNVPLWRAWFNRTTLKHVVLFALGASLTAGMGVLLYNYIRFGNPSETGYGGELQWIPIWEGVYGILFSSGKSIFLFAPPILLGLIAFPRFWQTHRLEAAVFALYIATAILFHGNFSDWDSRGAWGNRYLFLTLPYWILPLGAWLLQPKTRFKQIFVPLVVALGLFVQLLAVPINFDTHLNVEKNQIKRLYDPASSAIVNNATLLAQRTSEWLYQFTSNTDGFILLGGWLPSDGGQDELFPRYIAQRAELSIRADPNVPLYLTLVLRDFRPEGQARRTLRVWSNGIELQAGSMAGTAQVDLRSAVTIAAPHPNPVYLELETVGSKPVGKSPMGDELGFQVEDVIGSAGNLQLDPYPDLSIPPIPVANPFAAWGWFFDPRLPHWDFWWWYLYFSGIPLPQALWLEIPILMVFFTAVCLSGLGLMVGLRYSPKPLNGDKMMEYLA